MDFRRGRWPWRCVQFWVSARSHRLSGSELRHQTACARPHQHAAHWRTRALQGLHRGLLQHPTVPSAADLIGLVKSLVVSFFFLAAMDNTWDTNSFRQMPKRQR